MRALVLVVAVAQVACGWDYEVATVIEDTDVDVAVEDSTVDTAAGEDSSLEAAEETGDTRPASCPDAAKDADAAEGGVEDRCSQCAVNRCGPDAIACNGNDKCKLWLMCAGACTCPRFPCYNDCRVKTASDLAAPLIACMAKECLAQCN